MKNIVRQLLITAVELQMRLCALMLTVNDVQWRQWTKKHVSRRRSDLVVCPVKQSSSRRRSTDECLTRDDVFKTKKTFQHSEMIQSTWVVSQMYLMLSAGDVCMVAQAVRYVYRIRRWKIWVRATNTCPNISKWRITVLEVGLLLLQLHSCIV